VEVIPYSTCRPDEGGVPKCKLGYGSVNQLLFEDEIEVRGNSLRAIEICQETKECYFEGDKKKYDIVIVKSSPDRGSSSNGVEIGRGATSYNLIRLINRAGLNKNKIYYTNLVKCYTSHPLLVDNIKECTAHLQHELDRIKPKLVILLGNKTLRLFGLHKEGGVNNIRGMIFDLPLFEVEGSPKYKVMATMDPSIITVREDQAMENRLLEDYKRVHKILAGEDVDTSPYFAKYTPIDSIELLKDAVKKIKKEKLFAFDTESRSVPWYREPLICISLSVAGENFVLPIYKHCPKEDPDEWQLEPAWSAEERDEIVKILKDIFEDINIAKAGHNIKYEINVLRRHLEIRLQGRCYDTMLQHHLLHEQRPHDLEYLADIELGTGNYSCKIKEIIGTGKKLKKTYDWIPDLILWEYTATDAECTAKLAEIYYKRLAATPTLWNLYCDEPEKVTRPLAKAEWHGHQVDMNVIDKMEVAYNQESDALLMEIRQLTNPDFNPRSPPQLCAALKDAGYENRIVDERKKSGFTTDESVLAEIREESPLADKVLKYRKVRKLLETYVDNIRETIDKDGRLRYSWFIHGTESGRLSARFFHQLPRKNKKRQYNIKDALIVQPGYKMVYMDYDQLELRIAAILADDHEMIAIFADPNADIHRATAATILGWDVSQVNGFNRQNCGKNVNFGFIYGSQGHNLVKKGKWEDADGVERPITWEMLNRGMKRFKKKFPGISYYLESLPEITRANNNTLVTAFGRERRVGSKLNSNVFATLKGAEREVVNCSVQSPAGAITIRTLILIDEAIDEFIANGQLEEDDVFLINTVHDSGAWEVREKYVDWFCGILRTTAERKIPELSDMSFPCAIGVGRSITEAEANSDE
jgi:DNA polymerase-1